MDTEAVRVIEFGTAQWFAELETIMRSLAPDLLDAGSTDVYVIGTRYSDVPEHLVPDDGSAIGWLCRIQGTNIDFATGPDEVLAGLGSLDFEIAHQLATLVLGDDPSKMAEQARLIEKARQEGKLAPSDVTHPPGEFLHRVHDELAHKTR